MDLTENDAALAYSRMMNTMNLSEFVALLAPNARYASQWVFEELKGKKAIEKYLRGKINAIKETDSKVYCEMAVAQDSFPGKPCVAVAQDNKEEVIGVVVFEVDKNLIQRFDMCMPVLFMPKRSGIYPK